MRDFYCCGGGRSLSLALLTLVALAAMAGCGDDSEKESGDGDSSGGAGGTSSASGGQGISVDDDDGPGSGDDDASGDADGGGGGDGEPGGTAGSAGSAQSGAGAGGSGGGGTVGVGGSTASTGGTSSAPTACQTGSDCAATMECFAGKCAVPAPCDNSRDCEQPLVCGEGQCVECVTEAECVEGQACVGSACRDACDSDNDCIEDGLLCDGSSEDRHCAECLVDPDCADGRTCVVGRCEATETVASGGAGGGGAGGGSSVAGGEGGVGQGGTDSGTATACGDGLLNQGEGCDDGNTGAGDGCSDGCAVEEGFECEQQPVEGRVEVRAVYRDFSSAHSDFQPDNADGLSEATTGLVGAALDNDGKPVFAAEPNTGFISGVESFGEWYRDVNGVNSTYETTLALWDDGNGGLVNRYYENGDPWLETTEEWCGNVGQEVDDQECTFSEGEPVPCETDPDAMLECVTRDNQYYGTFLVGEHDGNPYFFPLDGVQGMVTPTEELATATLAPYYGGGDWPAEPSGALHNFHFTSELSFQFVAGGSGQQVLRLVGDDDVWVFVNGSLALDMGGIHMPVSGILEISPGGNALAGVTSADSESAPDMQDVELGLEPGQTYEVRIFHAERKTSSSTFLFSLSGFEVGRSVCSER